MGVVFYGQYLGDVSYGRLDKIPYIEPSIWHVLAPLALLILTRRGIPVSTSFLVLSAFASTFIMEKMLVKSFLGYGVAAVVAYIIWFIVSKFIDEKSKPNPKWDKWWRIGQWFSTGFLWTQWLQHDHANIAVFLPREHTWFETSLIVVFYLVVLGYVFKSGGGKIQKLLISKTSTKFIRSATIIDLVYAFLLLYFKQYNNIPMSTTFVFVGMLAGRELALNTYMMKETKLKKVFPLIGKEFLKLLFGKLVSVVLVLIIQYFAN